MAKKKTNPVVKFVGTTVKVGCVATYEYESENSDLPELPAAEELIEGETTTVKALPEMEGYRFYGWDNNGKTYNPWDTFTMPAKDTALVVTWEEVVEYNLQV